MVDLGQTLHKILASCPRMRLIVVRPTLSLWPSSYKSHLIHVQVLLKAMESSNPRIRVLPHYSMDPGMLGKDGVSMSPASSEKFLKFLADQLLDILGYFEMRDTPVEINLDENSNEARQTPSGSKDPRLQTPLSGGFNSTLGLSDSYSTPGEPRVAVVPRSGVSALFLQFAIPFSSSLCFSSHVTLGRLRALSCWTKGLQPLRLLRL